MRESIRPSDDELEKAFSVALSRPDHFSKDYALAREGEADLNEYLEDIDLSSSEAQECIDDIIEELNDDCSHVDATIEISGPVKRRTVNHRLINRGEPIPESAVTSLRESLVNHRATSLGYIALLDGNLENPATIYHLARSDSLDTVAFDDRYGAIYLRDRLFIPIDGSTHVELSGQGDPNWDLLDFYVDESLMDKIDLAFECDDLSSSLQQLGKVTLSQYKTLMDKKADPEIRRALIDYVNHGLDISYKNNIIYQISAANSVFIKDRNDKWITRNFNPAEVMFGTIDSVVIDQKAEKFHILAKVPFEDNTRRHVIYQLTSKLSITELPSFTVKAPRSVKKP